MNHPFSSLLSPVKVGNLVLKNRMTSTTSLPHFLQGPEPHPTPALINLLAGRAKNGAAVVTLSHTYASLGAHGMKFGGDTDHFPVFNMYDTQSQNYLIQLCDAIHYYEGKACLNLTRPAMPDWDVVDRPERGAKAYTEEMINKFIDCYVEQAVIGKSLGFDMGSIHFAYRSSFAGAFFSPITNTRTDEYGGSLEKRSKVILELFRRVKEACGQDYVLEGLISAEDLPGGYTFEDTKRFAKLSEGLIDILQIRMYDGDPSHPTGFNPNPTPTLGYAEELKSLGLKTLIAPVGGFEHPFVAENAIKNGQADLIAMARTWICEPEYGKKLMENRPEDITPCVRCNKCHVISHNQPYRSACTVNPAFGVETYVSPMEAAPSASKKVAVIGGGPAGMEAAQIAARRGHRVVLFEKSAQLGGQLNPASVPDFKWPLRDFTEYMVAQTRKAKVEVRLNTQATPALIAEEGFDVVLAAVGARPVVPPIPGFDGSQVITAIDALCDSSRIVGDVVVIGGGEIGVETGMYAGKLGHKVTVLEMLDEVARDTNPIHYRSMFQEAWESVEALRLITGARVTSITPSAVLYTGKDGEECSVPAQTVIMAAGTKGLIDNALSFYGSTGEFHAIGDCSGVGTVMTAMRSAFSVANQI